MRTNPFADALDFLIGNTGDHAGLGPFRFLFVLASTLLVLGSFVIAWRNWQADPTQRSARNIVLWLVRGVLGGMWLEGCLWKLPLPVTDGFSYWLGLTADNAAFSFYGTLLKSVFVPNIAVVDTLVFLSEFSLATALLLGVGVRAVSVLGIGIALNLWIGLYHYQAEWPWTYVFIIMLQVLMITDRTGRALGLDAMLQRRSAAPVLRLIG